MASEDRQADHFMMPSDVFYADLMWPDREMRNRRERERRAKLARLLHVENLNEGDRESRRRDG